jgi:hypothetical protein
MGKQSRFKREARAAKAAAKPEPSPREQFQTAMLESMIEEIHMKGQPCFLCGRHARHAGVFEPTTDRARRQLGTPAGEIRLGVYAFCDQCGSLPDLTTRVERVIFAGPPMEPTA